MAVESDDEDLTRRQREVLAFCRAALKDRGTMPTKREIASHLGIKNPWDVSPHLNALQRRGLLPLTESQVQQKLLQRSSSRWARRDWLDDLAHAGDLHAAMKATRRYADSRRGVSDPEFDHERNRLGDALWHLNNALEYLNSELDTVEVLRQAEIIGDEQAEAARDFLWSRLPGTLREAGFPEWAEAIESRDYTRAVPPRDTLEVAPPEEDDEAG